MALPSAMPDTVPDVEPTFAVPISLLLQVPAPVGSDKVVEAVIHMFRIPLIGDGNAFTVNGVVTIQPAGLV